MSGTATDTAKYLHFSVAISLIFLSVALVQQNFALVQQSIALVQQNTVLVQQSIGFVQLQPGVERTCAMAKTVCQHYGLKSVKLRSTAVKMANNL